ncbi:MAG TPA: hypothetical protein VG603_14625 [Chitinophagales bacterium]|nr:hypothetical protein [Chitinophagales bacterium]
MKNMLILIGGLSIILIAGCKHKTDTSCIPNTFSVNPFVERKSDFHCGSNNYDYTYIFRKKSEIDSLEPICSFSPPVPFPVDETDFVYIMFGKMSYFYKDSFQTILYKDTCLKKLTYDISMIQTHLDSLSNGGGVLSLFCSVENIPADYQVEVKYKYVPLQ